MNKKQCFTNKKIDLGNQRVRISLAVRITNPKELRERDWIDLEGAATDCPKFLKAIEDLKDQLNNELFAPTFDVDEDGGEPWE